MRRNILYNCFNSLKILLFHTKEGKGCKNHITENKDQWGNMINLKLK